jgi:hypothetical protein
MPYLLITFFRSRAEFAEQRLAHGHRITVIDSEDDDNNDWRVAAEYVTDLRAALNVHEIINGIYMRTTAFMHQSGLRMDTDYVSKPQDLYLWCLLSESKTAGILDYPMLHTCGCDSCISITESQTCLKLDIN